MTANNNLSVLPFYASVDEQNHRRSYAFGAIYPLYCKLGTCPPFQIVVGAETVTSAYLLNAEGTVVSGNILSVLTAGGLTKKSFTDYGVIVYPGNATSGITTAEGQYYLALGMSNGKTYYSDIFTVVTDVSPYLKIQWWDTEDLIMDGCRIVYELATDTYFKNTIYLSTEVGKPDYVFEEEGEKRDGLFFPEKMISEKTYKFTFLAAEYLCDVMRFIRMADKIQITDKYGRIYNCDEFLMTPKWETQGDLASVECEFQTNTVGKRIGRAIISNN